MYGCVVEGKCIVAGFELLPCLIVHSCLAHVFALTSFPDRTFVCFGNCQTHDKTLPKLAEYATRYATRPGGYTRIHLFGNRQGDHAPKAILELVDNPHDLRLEMTARAIGRETFARASKLGEEEVRHGKQFELPDLETDKRFNKITRRNIAKVTRFGGEESRARLAQIAQEHIERLNAIRAVEGPYREDTDKARSWKDNAPRGRALTKPHLGCKPLAGQEGEEPAASTSSFRRSSVIRIGRGIFAKRLGWRTAPQSVSRPRARPLSEA